MHLNQKGKNLVTIIVSRVKDIVEGDARYTVRDFARIVSISLSKVHYILKNYLKVGEIFCQLGPHLLTDRQKKQI